MGNVIANAEQVTPDWLTTVLQEQGILPKGKVICVTPGAAQATFASSAWHLEVKYSNEASQSAPNRLFLKTSSPALAPGAYDPTELHKENFFYAKAAPLMGASFIVPYYDAVFEPETGASHILLKDVSETHVSSRDPLDRRNCELAVDSLARLHAFWWDHPRLGKDFGKYPTPEERRQGCLNAETSTVAFMAELGDQLPQTYRAIYEQVLTALPGLFKRHASGRNLTLVHGDAHLGNFLFPKDPAAENVYLIDWQFWHPTIGGTDLAFMIATDWEPQTRRLLEKTLLQQYYRALLAYGVTDYSWEDCWNDYRLSVILVSIFIPVWQWSSFHWEPKLSKVERSMTAFEDLKCSELLKAI